MGSIVCSLGITPDGRRDSRQGVGCGKEVLKDLRNAYTGRWVSREAASASMFSTPGMRFMGTLDLGLTCYTRGFSEEGADGGSCANAATAGPALCGGVVHPCGDVFERRHAWGEKLEVGDVRCQF